MAGKTITGANAVYLLAITDVFPTPQQLQQFAADDVFSTDPLGSAEVIMGVDRRLSGGFVAVPVKQSISLMADSDSMDVFDQWWAAMQAEGDTFIANGVVLLPSLGQKWTLTKGFLTDYMPIPDTKKLVQARKFGITWESVSQAPI